MFISFEGIEGAGKSTQIKLLSEYLINKGCETVTTFEPGATHFGAQLRRVLLDPKTELKNGSSELCLFMADRLEHISQVIQPALDADKYVLTDRYLDSTIAYQCGGRGVSPEILSLFLPLISLQPELTFLLDTDPLEGLRRAKARAELDRFEQEALSFHQRVRDQFLDIAKKNPSRVHVIQVDGLSIDEVFDSVKIMMDSYIDNKEN